MGFVRSELALAAGQGASLAVRDLVHDLRPGERLLSLPALDLAPGGLIVLTGPSGSGKSTLLHLLAGLIRPTEGSVSWNGVDIARLSESARDRWRRSTAGFIFQDFHLIPELPPVDNILLPALFSAFSSRPYRERAEALLTRFDVPGRSRTALLSRGEQQRVALARALLLEPAVIFADEPTASLDAHSGDEVARALRSLARGEGRTVIAASHDPALIALADRRLALLRGHEGVLS